MKRWNRWILLTVVMVFAMLPFTALADDGETSPELAAAEERLLAAQAEYDYWLTQKNDLDVNVENAKAETNYWAEQVKNAEAERKTVQDALRACTAEKKSLQTQVRGMNNAVNSLSRELAKKQLTEAEAARYAEMTAQVEQLEALGEVLADASVKMAEAIAAVGANDAEIEKLRALQLQYELGSDEWQAMQDEIDTLASQSDALNATRAEAESVQKEAEVQYQALQATVKANNRQLVKLASRKEAAEALAQELNDKQAQVAELQIKLDATILTESTLQTDVATATEKVTAARASLNAAKDGVNQARDYKVILKNVSAAKIALDAAQAAYDALL